MCIDNNEQKRYNTRTCANGVVKLHGNGGD